METTRMISLMYIMLVAWLATTQAEFVKKPYSKEQISSNGTSSKNTLSEDNLSRDNRIKNQTKVDKWSNFKDKDYNLDDVTTSEQVLQYVAAPAAMNVTSNKTELRKVNFADDNLIKETLNKNHEGKRHSSGGAKTTTTGLRKYANNKGTRFNKKHVLQDIIANLGNILDRTIMIVKRDKGTQQNKINDETPFQTKGLHFEVIHELPQ